MLDSANIEDKKIIDRLFKSYYPPSESNEWYDPETGAYYNSNYSRLRDVQEYDSSSEGYTPFGDE